ncbi:Predicted signal transduction protein [hydrothermal vent metagenome]|uniref:Predicted signal transduction protein n=1 Tax=hydrothermal vent metagenome TaxID=652676 RepID=A0A3B0ZL38_9ZZZZ
MKIVATVIRYLDRQRVGYKIHKLASFESSYEAAEQLAVSPDVVLRAIPLVDQFGLMFAIVSSPMTLNAQRLSQLMGREVSLATKEYLQAELSDGELNYVPPLGAAFGLRTIMDDELVNTDVIYILTGSKDLVVSLAYQDFLKLQSSASLVADFTEPLDQEHASTKKTLETKNAEVSDLRTLVNDLNQLPPMPELAHKIFQLSSDEKAGVAELVAIVEIDPSLSAQVLRYARSPLFNYPGQVDSIQTAISRVLGFDMVMNLSLGLATAKSFKIQPLGPLGLGNYWRHAIYSAALAQNLAKEVKGDCQFNPGLLYLAGLLHNFGHLLMGHLFKNEFASLNNLVAAHPETPVSELEIQIFGITHTEVGAQLMDKWRLPEEIIVAAREHHNPDYDGEHAAYAKIVMLADYILKGHGMGDAPSQDVPEALLSQLGLTEIQTLMAMNHLLEGCDGFNEMAVQIAKAA